MKEKKIIFSVISVLAVFLALVYYFVNDSFHPSQQLKELESIEKSLNLPESDDRYSSDKGFSKDYKGAPHYERFITLYYYDDMTVLDLVRPRLVEAGWKEYTENYQKDNSPTSYFYRGQGKDKQCIIASFGEEFDTKKPYLSISLEANGEYSLFCDPTRRKHDNFY